MSRQGDLYIVAAPSGAGKSSLVNALVKSTEDIVISISTTTREPRPGEVDGKEYHFVAKDEFEKLIDKQQFLEHAAVFGNYYGTSKQWVEQKLADGKDVILEIDWQGAEQVRALFPSAVSIYIVPPSRKVLFERLQARGQDSDAVIERRMQQVTTEMEHYKEFDYLVANNLFDDALRDLQRIVHARRLLCTAQSIVLADQLAELLETR